MSFASRAVQFEGHLRQRLTEIRPVLAGELVDAFNPAAASTIDLLRNVVGLARRNPDSRSAWLLFIALGGCFPVSDEVDETRRLLELSRSDAEAVVDVLAATKQPAIMRGIWDKPMRLVRGATIVDVNFCAKHEHNTGIQRLVRETVTRWSSEQRPIELVAWDGIDAMTRTLTDPELQRVIAWSDPDRDRNARGDYLATELVVPVDCIYLVVEVTRGGHDYLSALTRYSGNSVRLVGYDAIPVVSADLVIGVESERFARYLSIVKYADMVFGISAAATEEFAGFVKSVRGQGLVGPEVREISLPVDLPEGSGGAPTPRDRPLVLSVGSHEPRKNQEALLYAAEVLWREGLEFDLTFVGGGDSTITAPFDQRAAVLRSLGRTIETLRSVSDDELAGLFRSAHVTVFASLHEGYGLPVAESLGVGTPVITGNYGSTAEIAAGGGCVTIDPRDDDALVAALRSVLTEEKLMASLRQQISQRNNKTWDDYALELWNAGQAVIAP